MKNVIWRRFRALESERKAREAEERKAPKCIYTEGEGDHPDNPKSCYNFFRRRKGLWELRAPNILFKNSPGLVQTGAFVNGKEHGQWEIRHANGTVETGPAVNGKWHGRWEVRSPNGRVATGPVVNGQWHGQWEFRWPNGTVEYSTWENGEEIKSSRTDGPCK